MGGIKNTFNPGDRVCIIGENRDVDLPPDCDADNLENHGFKIGTEFTLSDDFEDHYDPYDNSWLLKKGSSRQSWVHEGALDYPLQPVTQDEEDAALESIRKALSGND